LIDEVNIRIAARFYISMKRLGLWLNEWLQQV
jgi:hypothetical protein